MSDRRLLVSDADIDIARLLVKLDRLEGRESDPATLRVAGAAAFDDDADGDAEYDMADDVVPDYAFAPVPVVVEPGDGGTAAEQRFVVRRRPWVKVGPTPSAPGIATG